MWRELVLGELTQGFSSVRAWTSYLFSPNPGTVSLQHLCRLLVG